MRLHDAGQLAPALDEFQAAYASVPDPRLDREGRQQLIGSMLATLLAMHAASGEAAPLCQLQGLLQTHADALSVAYPEDPDMLEVRSVRARHEEVTRRLAAFGPDPCAPPPAPTPATPVVPAPPPAPAPATPVVPASAPRPTPAPPPAELRAARRLQIAGGVVLPLGVLALAGLGAAASHHRSVMARAGALDDELDDRPATTDDRTHMLALLTAARRDEGLIVALGLARLGLDLRPPALGLTISGAF